MGDGLLHCTLGEDALSSGSLYPLCVIDDHKRMCVEEDPWNALEGHPLLHVGDELGGPYEEVHVPWDSSCVALLSLKWPHRHSGVGNLGTILSLEWPCCC